MNVARASGKTFAFPTILQLGKAAINGADEMAATARRVLVEATNTKGDMKCRVLVSTVMLGVLEIESLEHAPYSALAKVPNGAILSGHCRCTKPKGSQHVSVLLTQLLT